MVELDDGYVHYEAFGATGDGVTDDHPAICAAHDYGNEHGLPVRAQPGASYHLGRRALTAVIATDTDWNTARFTIDDSDVEDHTAPLFAVRSLLEPIEVELDSLQRDQKQLDVTPERDCHVRVENDRKRIYIRRGRNQNNGVPQCDVFVLRRDGTITGAIDWDYPVVTRATAQPIDDSPLTLSGGIFTTVANRMSPDGNSQHYWARNIVVSRSNTLVEGLTHHIMGETDVGSPYNGFISVTQCAFVTLRNCFGTGHKIYSYIGSAGEPVSMGSYDYGANGVVGFHMQHCRMHHITDQTRWGVIGSNHCKDILLEDCHLSRMDTHMGVSGSYIIRRCTLGWQGLNAIGRGHLLVEDSTLHGNSLLNFRQDYGSTWEGDVEIRRSRWIPACGRSCWPFMINFDNDGTHDFGYPCSMPTSITVDELFVDDSKTPDGYQGMYLLADPDGGEPASADKPFPYQYCERISIRALSTASGKPPQLSPSAAVAAHTKLEQQD